MAYYTFLRMQGMRVQQAGRNHIRFVVVDKQFKQTKISSQKISPTPAVYSSQLTVHSIQCTVY